MPAILQPTTAPQSFSQSAVTDPWTFTGVTVDQGPNRALIAFVMVEGSGVTGDRTVTGITYGGRGLSKLDAQTAPSWGGIELWVLHDPEPGTASVVVDLNAATRGVLGVLVAQRIDGTLASARVRAASKTSGTGTSASVTVAGVTGNDLVFSGLHIDGTGHAAAPGADQTEVADRDSASGSNTGVVNTQLGSAGGVMSNTWTGSNPYALIAAAFQGAPPPPAKGYSQFNGAGSATVDLFRIPGVDVGSGDGFVAYALVRPGTDSVGIRSMSILEFRDASNTDSVLLEIDSAGYFAWSNQSGVTMGDGWHQAAEGIWTLVVWEKMPGGYSEVKLHVCDDVGGSPAWSHYTFGYDSDPLPTPDGLVSVSNFDFLAFKGDIACWGVWATDWLAFEFSGNDSIEAAFSGFTTAGLLASAVPPWGHFELNNQGYAENFAGNAPWHDWSNAPVVSDPTVPWGFTTETGGSTVTGTRAFIIDSIQAATAAKTGALDTTATAAGVRSGFYEAFTGIAGTRILPWDASAGVSALRAGAYDAIAQLVPVRAGAYEALGQVAGTRLTPWEALQAVTRTAPVPFEALQGVGGARAMPFDSEGSVVLVNATAILNIDTTAAIAAAAAGNYEALASLAGARAGAYEALRDVGAASPLTVDALGGVLALAAMPWDSVGTGLVQITGTAILTIDTVAMVAASGPVPYDTVALRAGITPLSYEAQQGAGGTRATAFEALGGVAATSQLQLDSTGALQLQAALSWDATATVATARLAPWESQLGLVRAVPLAYDATGGVLVAAIMPWEAAGIPPIPELDEPLQLRAVGPGLRLVAVRPDTRLVIVTNPLKLGRADG